MYQDKKYIMQFVNINGHLIHYKHIVSKEQTRTFVFINSIGTDFRIWDEVANTVKEHGNVLLFDNRGHGLSDVVEGSNSLDDFTSDTAALLDHLSIQNCVIVGLSLGGMIAKMMASSFPHRIDKLVLCDTGYKIGNTDFWNGRIALVKEKGLDQIWDAVAPRWFSEKFRNEEPVKVRGYKNMLERIPVAGYINACEAIRDADLKETASKIDKPTLCVVGSEDKSTTPADVKDLADVIKGSKYAVIEGSGHLPCVDNPQALSKLIINFATS